MVWRMDKLVAACRDVLYLDLALEGAIRTTVESGLEAVKQAAPDSRGLLQLTCACLESVCMSLGSNQELLLSLKDFQVVPLDADAHA